MFKIDDEFFRLAAPERIHYNLRRRRSFVRLEIGFPDWESAAPCQITNNFRSHWQLERQRQLQFGHQQSICQSLRLAPDRLIHKTNEPFVPIFLGLFPYCTRKLEGEKTTDVRRKFMQTDQAANPGYPPSSLKMQEYLV